MYIASVKYQVAGWTNKHHDHYSIYIPKSMGGIQCKSLTYLVLVCLTGGAGGFSPSSKSDILFYYSISLFSENKKKMKQIQQKNQAEEILV